MHENDNIEVSPKLASDTIKKAQISLHKKRFRILTVSTLAVVVCAITAIFFIFGGEPSPDLVNIQGTPLEGQGLAEPQSYYDELALNRARFRKAQVIPLERVESIDTVESPEIDFGEDNTFYRRLEGENVSEELLKYRYIAKLPEGEEYKDYVFYIVIYKAPQMNLRYVDLPLKLMAHEIVFRYTSLDVGPFPADKYGAGRVTIPAESGGAFLIILPPGMDQYSFSAKYVRWDEMTDNQRAEVVFDTVTKHEDLKSVIEQGVGNSLAFELAILSDFRDESIEYFKKFLNEVRYYDSLTYVDYIAQYILYNLLNDYQLDAFDTTDPEQAIKKELLSQAMSDEDKNPDCLIIPEIQIIEQILGQPSPTVTGCATVCSFNPPASLDEHNFIFEAKLAQNKDGEWEIRDIFTTEVYESEYEEKLAEYDSTLSVGEINEIYAELKQAAQDKFYELTVYATEEPLIRISSPNAKVTRSFISVPLVVDTAKKGADQVLFESQSPIVIYSQEYAAELERYGLVPDEACHFDALKQLNDYAPSAQYFNTYIVLFPAFSKATRYDAVSLIYGGHDVSFQYTLDGTVPSSDSRFSVKGFLIYIAHELECENLMAAELPWGNIPQDYQTEILIDRLATSVSDPFDAENPYSISPERSDDIRKIYEMGDPVISTLRDMRYRMDLSSAIIDYNRVAIVDGLLNMMIQAAVERNLDNNTVDTAISQYLYGYYKNNGFQQINTCTLFAYLPIDIDYSEFERGYITYYMMVCEDRTISINNSDFIYFPAKITVKQNEGETWEVTSFEKAETAEETQSLFGSLADKYNQTLNTQESLLLARNTRETFNMWLGEFGSHNSAQTPPEDNTSSEWTQSIYQNMLSNMGEAHDPYSAISRELVTYDLDGVDDGKLQVVAITPLSEDYVNPITVAVLAATYDENQTEDEYAQLYVVTAEFDETNWELKNIDVSPRQSLTMEEFPKLAYRGGRYTEYTLHSMLTSRVRDISRSLPAPILSENNQSGFVNLGFASGSPRFVKVERLVYPEHDAGVTFYMWYVEEDASWLSSDSRLDAIKNADWEKIEELNERSTAGYKVTTPGLVGISMELHLEYQGLMSKVYITLDTEDLSATLWLTDSSGNEQYFRCYDTNVYSSIVDIFGVETDVSQYMISDNKGPTLPEYREELRYLVPIVGDMPGGIVSIEAVGPAYTDTGIAETVTIDGEDELIDWAETVGNALEDCNILENSGYISKEFPLAVFDVNLAPQEGIGHLKMTCYKDDIIYIVMTYRLYGRADTIERKYTIQNRELFDTLFQLSFGDVPER